MTRVMPVQQPTAHDFLFDTGFNIPTVSTGLSMMTEKQIGPDGMNKRNCGAFTENNSLLLELE